MPGTILNVFQVDDHNNPVMTLILLPVCRQGNKIVKRLSNLPSK